ncbi:ComEA family DNA-binding protein [Hydrocarboniphaga sp.]|uniref:ComEA family DNA-binding protein n=1 Tax=Hydrocarboniphaga sp. TaxID=2033016 RepID=UPI003D0D9F9F
MNSQFNLRQWFLALMLLSFSSLGWAAVNINTADAKTIAKELDGVGEKMAAVIVAERAKTPFTSLDDVDKRVKGWGKKTSEKNKDKIKFADK